LIKPALLIDLSSLLNAFRKKLSAAGQLMESIFEINALKLSENGIKYQDIDAEWIIFCDGTTSFTNPEFRNLPFAPNKGEVLIIETEGIPMTKTIYKKGISLVPLENNLFWVGSSYDWEFKNEAPDRIFRERTELLLLDWLKRPFTILDHRAAVRPATLERRPFVGFHPLYEHVGILNGMGTKGCSLAPYFSNQLVENIVTQKPVLPEADIRRFSKILSRP
jgi:glycine/D-amino acid oxidase-like deaminating enzyme